MKPGDAAKILGVDRSTITRWTANEFRRYMSPSAQGGTGKQRVVTDRDLRVLYLIKTLKETNTPVEEIHSALQQIENSDWQDLPPMPEAPPGVAEFPVVPAAAADAALSTERRALLREIALLQERLDDYESQRNADQETILDLTRRLAEAETELRLFRAGRLKPEE